MRALDRPYRDPVDLTPTEAQELAAALLEMASQLRE